MTLIVAIIILALCFDFLNGFHDSANSIATVVATRVLTPRQAVMMAAIANFVAAFVFTTAVAATIGKGIVNPQVVAAPAILIALISASVWNIITWYWGIPISSSHALIGSLIGTTLFKYGAGPLIYSGIAKTLIFIIIAPLLGFMGAVVFTFSVLQIIKNRSSQSSLKTFGRLQILSSFLYSLGHGSNDAQKTMGIISLTLFSNGLLGRNFTIPVWVILSSHAAIAFGTYFGGWRIVKTMATKIIRLRTFEGCCAETSSAITLFSMAHLGIPVSTTHVINGSIIGVGTVENYKKVRWINTRKIFLAWLITIPISLIFGFILMAASSLFLH